MAGGRPYYIRLSNEILPGCPTRASFARVGLFVTSRFTLSADQVVEEFLSVALRSFADVMGIAESEYYLASVFRPLLAIQSSQALLAEGLRLYERYRLSWYDSLIVAAALEAQCSVLYSEDMRHGQRFGDLRVENPFR